MKTTIENVSICYLEEGRGKTGKAKTGKPRMLFRTLDDLETFNNFVRAAWKHSGCYVPFDEYLAQSRKNLLDKPFKDVWDLTAACGLRIVMVNTSTIDPRIDIERETERRLKRELEEQKAKRLLESKALN